MSARAPSYDVLYEFETQIEEAFSIVLNAQTSLSCLTQRYTGAVSTPRYELQFVIGAGSEHYGRAADGLAYPDQFSGTLLARHVSARLEDSGNTQHRVAVAKLRRYLYQFETFVTESVLPYLEIQRVLEAGSIQEIDAELKQDITELTFTIHFAIRPAAWPAI